jgi:hypothetical protein
LTRRHFPYALTRRRLSKGSERNKKTKEEEEEEKGSAAPAHLSAQPVNQTTATTAHFFLWARSRREAQGGFGRVALGRPHLPHSPPCAPHPPPSRRSSLSLSLPFLPLSVPVDSAAAVVPGALRWDRRRTWGCGWRSREDRGVGREWR